MDLIRKLVEKRFKKAPMAEFRAGDTVQVHVKITEGEKSRVQIFEGLCIRAKKGGLDSSFTVRKMSNGVGVERIFPYYSSGIDRVSVLARGQKTRRARLYYIRDLEGKAARVESELESVADQNAAKDAAVAENATRAASKTAHN